MKTKEVTKLSFKVDFIVGASYPSVFLSLPQLKKYRPKECYKMFRCFGV